MKLKHTLILLLIVSIPKLNFSQNLTSSPYSIFGIGEINPKGSSLNVAMGGSGIALKSVTGLNSLNPASYNTIDSLFFIYEIGIMGEYSMFSSDASSQDQIVSNLCYFSLGFSAKKWWGVSFGLAPFSSVGYEITTISNMENDNTIFDDTYSGSGGINQIYMGNSFSLSKNISFGVNLSYLFGLIEEDEEISLSRSYTDYTIHNGKNVNGLYLDYGIQVSLPAQKYNWVIGAIWGNKKQMSSSNDKSIYDYDGNILYSEEDVELEDDYLIPRKFGLGFSFSKKDKYTLALDYLMNEWSEAEFSNENLKTKNSHKLSVGFEITPEGRYGDVFLKNWYYRIGGYYNRSYLTIDNQSINSMALTLGFGIPVKRNLSMVNIAFEIGKNGTLNKGLIQENFYSINLNLSLQDIWFLKKKFQ
jgi:hypothetical protein